MSEIIKINKHILDVDWSTLPIPQAIVTSPPYWQKRQYPIIDSHWADGLHCQLGQEPSVELYIEHLVNCLVSLPLSDDGTMWVNVDDTWNEKNLSLVPDRLALAMLGRGYHVRSKIIWHKSNGLPQSVTDRPPHQYETILLLTKSSKYKYRQDSIQIPIAESSKKRYNRQFNSNKYKESYRIMDGQESFMQKDTRALRDVWNLSVSNSKLDHTAPMPLELSKRCILLSTDAGDVVLDPFAGSGTTARMALKLGRDAVAVDLDSRMMDWLTNMQVGLQLS